MSNHQNGNIFWRIAESGTFIEQSLDAGETWHKVYEFPLGEQVRKYYYRPYPQNFGPHSRIIYPGGPYNGVVDEATGNLVVSMGFEGVVVVTEEGEIKRVAVDEYSFVDIQQLSVRQRLHSELFLAIWLACLVISILTIPLLQESRFKSIYIGGAIIATIIWLLFCLFSKEVGFIHLLQQLLVFIKAWGVYPILAVIGSTKIIQERVWRLNGFVMMVTAASVMLFILPLLLWANGRFPVYQVAMTLSLFMVFLLMQYAYRRVNERSYG